MTRPDRESRFDDVDLTTLTIVELEDYLSKIVDRHVIIPDAFLARAYELRISEVQARIHREVAIRNRRETERQEALTDHAAARTEVDARHQLLVKARTEVGCEIEKRDAALARVAELERLLAPLLSAQDLTSGLVASADRVRAVVRAIAVVVLERDGLAEPHRSSDADDIADRVAAQLTAPPPGHVCPAPYGLGPEDVDEIEAARNFVERHGGFQSTIDVLGKILAEHRAPTPTIEPLPEVIACGTVGCVSSIKKHLLPAGWLLLDGRWRCPRCKVIATSEAS